MSSEYADCRQVIWENEEAASDSEGGSDMEVGGPQGALHRGEDQDQDDAAGARLKRKLADKQAGRKRARGDVAQPAIEEVNSTASGARWRTHGARMAHACNV